VLTIPCVPAACAAATESLRLKGNAVFKQGQLQAALLHYKAAVALDPCNPLLYNNISLVHLKLGKVTEVRRC
jgi:Flp pilus assembly protein TadD